MSHGFEGYILLTVAECIYDDTASSSMTDDLEAKLKKLQEAHDQLKDQLAESLAVLSTIDTTIDGMKLRQAERMRADERVDDAIIDQVQGND